MNDFKIFDTLLEPVFILNKERKVIYCNEPAALLCDLSIRRILKAKDFLEILRFKPEPPDWLSKLTDIKAPTAYKELNFESASGSQGKIQITAQPLSLDQKEEAWLIYFRDVTLEETLQKKYRAELEQKEDVILDLQKAQKELQNYSKNLEKMVEERTAEISELNHLLKALLDSLGQGFFVFNKEGKCLSVTSKACQQTVQTNPSGQYVWDVLKLGENQVSGFKKWLTTIFAEMLPFSDLAALGPQRFTHSEGRHISLEYYPMRNPENQMDGVVVVASDITNLVEAQAEAERERHFAELITTLIRNKRGVLSFINESKKLLIDLENVTQKSSEQNHEELFRVLHTLKGGAASFAAFDMAEQCHKAENILTELRFESDSEAQKNYWQKLDLIKDEINNHFSQYIETTQDVLGKKIESERTVEIPAKQIIELADQVRPLPGGEKLAQNLVYEYACEPISFYFESYQDITQEVAQTLSKQVEPIKFIGGDLRIWAEAYSDLFNSCVHAFRNAIDHGIEAPHLRQEIGKPEAGKISVEFKLEKKSSSLKILIKDDGGGISPEAIRNKLSKQGIVISDESDEQIIQHVFDSQFSTRDEVTETSGRGVGMDAIRFAAEKLGGQVYVKSSIGKGTELYIEVPYITAPLKDLKAVA